MIMKQVSIIVPAHNEEKHIEKSLNSLITQTYENIQIIVVVDNSTDNTFNVAKKVLKGFPDFRIMDGNHGSAARTRNQGAMVSHGDILIFHDADCVADKNMVKNVVKQIENGYDGVATKTDVVNPKTLIERAIKAERSIGWEMNQSSAVEISKGAPVLVANMKKSAFNKLGGFNEKIFYFEDQDLTNRFFDMGFKACFAPDVIEYHNDPSTLSEQINQSLQNGKGIRTLLKQGKFHKILIPLYPFVFLGGVISIFFGNFILAAILFSPLMFLYFVLLSKSDDVLGVVTFLPLFLIRNVFKLIGMIKG